MIIRGWHKSEDGVTLIRLVGKNSKIYRARLYLPYLGERVLEIWHKGAQIDEFYIFSLEPLVEANKVLIRNGYDISI